MKGMTEIRCLASLGLAARAEAKIKVRQPLSKLIVRDNYPWFRDERLMAILKSEMNVKEIIFDPKLANEVALDTTITPALREEGLLREIARMFQELRQKAGLEPKDKIVAMMELSLDAKNAVMNHEAQFKKDIGAATVEYGLSDKFLTEETIKFDGQEAWAAIRKV